MRLDMLRHPQLQHAPATLPSQYLVLKVCYDGPITSSAGSMLILQIALHREFPARQPVFGIKLGVQT